MYSVTKTRSITNEKKSIKINMKKVMSVITTLALIGYISVFAVLNYNEMNKLMANKSNTQTIVYSSQINEEESEVLSINF